MIKAVEQIFKIADTEMERWMASPFQVHLWIDKEALPEFLTFLRVADKYKTMYETYKTLYEGAVEALEAIKKAEQLKE
jgi:hypothetical protein